MVIINAKINTCENGLIIPQGYLEVTGSKITKIGGGIYKGTDPDIIDAAGDLVVPGFVDSHCHIGIWEDGLVFEGDDTNEQTDPCTPQLRAIDAVNPLDRSFSEALAYGITTVSVGPGSANPIAGQVCVLSTSGKYVDQMVIKSPSAIKFALGENPKNVYNEKDQGPVTRMAIASIMREALQKAQRYQQDLEKSEEDEDTDPPELDVKCEALLPLLRREIKAHFHAHRADDICTALRIAKEFNLDAVIIHCTDGHLVTEAIREQGAGVSCGPIISSRTKPELLHLERYNAAKLYEAGIPVALNSDAPVFPVDLLATSAAMANKAGLPWQAALEALTIRGAEVDGVADRVGSLKEGKDADILILDEDPIALLVKPRCIIAQGKIVKNDGVYVNNTKLC